MAQRLRQFLAPDSFRVRRVGPSADVALFGKHPAEGGFFEIGLPRGSSLEEAYGWLFLGGITSNYDAWVAIPAERRVEFNHPFVWFRKDRWLAGWMTESRDSAGAGGYPLVVCAEFHHVDMHRALPSVLSWLDECRQCLMAASSLERIREILRTRHAKLGDVIKAFPLESGRPVPLRSAVEAFLRAHTSESGELGLKRLTGIVESDLTALLAGSSWYSHASSLPTYRVPGLPDLGVSLSTWAHWFDCLLGKDIPILLVQSGSGSHLDVFLGQPGDAALSALRRDTSLVGFTTERPREVDTSVIDRWQRVQALFRADQRESGKAPKLNSGDERSGRNRLVVWSSAVASLLAITMVVGWWVFPPQPQRRLARHLSTLEKSFVRLPDSLVEGEKVVFSFSTNFAAIAKDSAWNSGATLSASNRYKELRTKYHLWTNELGTRRLAVNRAKEDLQKLSASPVKGLEQILKTRIDLTNITQRLGKDSELLSRDQQTALLKLSEAERAFANLGARQKDVKVRGEELIQNAKNTLSLGVQADTNQMVSLAAGLFRLNQEAMTNGLSQLASELASSAVSLSNAIPLVVAQQGQGHVRDEIGLRLKTLRERFSVLSEYSLGKDWENLLEDSGRLVADSRSANLRDLTEEADQFRAAVQSGRQGAQRLDLLVREVRARLGELEKLLGKDPATTSPDEIAVGRQTLEKLKAEVPRLKSAELQKQLTRVAAEMVRIEKRENLRRLERTFEHVKSQIELARTNAASRATLLSQLDALEEELEPLSDPDFVARIKSARANVASLQDVVPNQGGTGVEPIKQGSDPNSKPGLKGVTMGSFQLPLVEMTLLGKRMWVGASEVTRGEFLGVMGHLPKGWKDSADVALTGPVSGAGDRYPATFVSPMEAEEFCRRLGEAAGGSTPPKRLRYRLPTWQEHQELRGALESEPAFNLKGRGLRERPVEVRRLVDAWGNAAELASKDGGWVLVGASYSDRDTAINSMTSNPAPAKDPPVVTQGFRVVAETLP